MILSSHGIIGSSIGQFDPDAAAFFSRVTAAGGTLSATEQTAVNQLVLDMKDDGIWTKMKAIYPMVGASQAACAQNLKSSSFTGTFTSGWTFASTGVTPNGTSAYMDTGVNPSLLTNWIGNHHQSFYNKTQNPSGSGWNMGIGDTSNGLPVYGLAVIRSGDNAIYDAGNFPDARNSSTQTDARAFWLGSCTAADSRKFYKNGTTIATKTISQTPTASNGEIAIGGFYQTNTSAVGFFMDHQCAFASIGDGLTDDEAGDFYTAVQAFQTTLSRQV